METAQLQRQKLPELPARIEGLAALAVNLVWSWHRNARDLFHRVDPVLWRLSQHNPITLLNRVSPDRLEALTRDGEFLGLYDRVMEWFAVERSAVDGWFEDSHPDVPTDRPIAYFCAEFGLHASVPIYSGGLGVLAGDHCKTASDLGLPFVGVGLFYKKGYFDQRVRPDGWQEDGEDAVQPERTPLVPVEGPEGRAWVTEVEIFGRAVRIRAWTMQVGRAPLYLLDTDLEENHPDDRSLTSRLYSGGLPMRLRQEWVLGVGGVRMLRAVGIDPAAWHANEGHAAFLMLERLRESVTAGMVITDAVREIRRTSIFTTHTPVPAGHDHFDLTDVRDCAGEAYLADFGDRVDDVIALGVDPSRHDEQFHMTALAIRLAGHVNGVAQRHGIVSREMWRHLWSERAADQVPIGAVTNGVHLETWMANPMMRLLDRHLGSGWNKARENAETWDAVLGLESETLWRVHERLKNVLITRIRDEARRRWKQTWSEAAQVVAGGSLLDPQALTIGFARRFATYKRANLLFRDIERLRILLTDQQRPVQLIIAGKAHPQDNPGKEVLQSLYHFTRDPVFEGRVAFLEDYDMHLAHLLVQGVDLWLNVPRVPLEASGTSGMKAALNGVPHLSTLDGWWEEGATAKNGWTIPRAEASDDIDVVDGADAGHLYRLLEEEIVPMWYDRDEEGVPREWVARMKEAIRIAGRHFTSRRMVQDYTERYYVPTLRGDPFVDDPPLG